MHLFSRRNFKIWNLETLHTMKDNHLFTENDKLGSNLLFLKQNLANSIILPPKNGGLKAWSHGVRKANFTKLQIRLVAICDLQTCYNLLKQIASSLRITSFDNQLATSLLTTCIRLALKYCYILVLSNFTPILLQQVCIRVVMATS